MRYIYFTYVDVTQNGFFLAMNDKNSILERDKVSFRMYKFLVFFFV